MNHGKITREESGRILDHLAINFNKIQLQNITFDTYIPTDHRGVLGSVKKIDYERMPGCFLGLVDEWLWLLSISDPNYTTPFIVSSLKTAMTLCTTERNIRLKKDVSIGPHFTSQVLEFIGKKNNLKNTLTKRRKNCDVHNDSYNNCSRRYEELCSQLTRLKQQEKRKLNHRRFENPKTGRKTWMDINNVLRNHRKPDHPLNS
jgi:hypothetical protein